MLGVEPGGASGKETIAIVTQLHQMTGAQALPTAVGGIVGNDDNADSVIPLDPAHQTRMIQILPHACRSEFHPLGVRGGE